MDKILVVAEHYQGRLSHSFLSVLGAAHQLGTSFDILLLAADEDTDQLASICAQQRGCATVWCLSDESFKHPLAENVARVVHHIAHKYSYILAASSTFGKNFMPRVAAQLYVEQISDVTKIIDGQTFVRPIYAGNAFETIQSTQKTKVLTIRTTMFEPVGEQSQPAVIEQLLIEYVPHPDITFEKEEMVERSRPDLTSARVIISGGRGLGSKENFQLLEKIADRLNAAIGASRAAVDAGFVPNEFQIGQTGKMVAPDLYIAVGISGAIQHLAGMKDSKVVVAINKDPEAPIFQIADYGLVGDLFDILPEFEKSLELLN